MKYLVLMKKNHNQTNTLRTLAALALMLMTLNGSLMFAQEELTVYDGTTTNSYVPIYGFYADAYLKCEYVIPSTDLDEMNGGTISAMRFYANTTAASWTGTFQVFLREVNSTSISAYQGPGTVVYTGALGIAGGEMLVTFTTPFTYNGGNLLVGVYETATGNYPSSSWYGQTVTGASVQAYNYNGLDAITATQRNFIPKTTFYYTSVQTCPRPAGLSVSGLTTTSVSINWTAGGSETSWDIYWSTSSTAPTGSTAPSATSNTNSYTITGLTPETTYYIWVRANCGGGDVSNWSVGCDATPAICRGIGSGSGTNQYLPSYGLYNYSLTQQIYTSSEIGPAGELTTIQLYNTGSQLIRTYDIYIVQTNKTSFTSTTDWISVTSSDLFFSGSVTLVDGDWTVITLSDPFHYDGTSNIALIIDDNTGSWTSGQPFRVYSATDQAIYVYNDNTNYDPASPSYTGTRPGVKNQVKFCLEPATSCPIPTGLAITSFGQSATVTWTAGDGTQWDVAHSTNSSVDPSNNIVATVNTPTYTMDNLAISATHYFWVRRDCGGGEYSDWGGPVSVTIDYCTPAPTSVDNSGITNVRFQIGGSTVYENSTTHPNNSYPPLYGDYSAQIIDVTAGDAVDVLITYATGYTYPTYIWVDLDNSLSFESTEILASGVSTNTNPTTLTLTITIPSDLPAGNYRLRIGGADSGMNSGGDPCYASSYGVFEDYTLSVSPDNCPDPTNVTVSDITDNSAQVSWTGTASNYNVRYRRVGITEGFESGIPANWTTIDADGDGNNWLPLSQIPTTYPYYTMDLSNWAHTGINSATSPSAYNNTSGSYDALTTDHWLITPRVNLGGTLKFYAANADADYLDEYEVLLSTTGNAPANFNVTLKAMAPAPHYNSWEEVNINLSSYSGQQGYIAIHHVSDNMYFLLIDDFDLGEEWTNTSTNTTSITLTGLEPETAYEVQVQADCGVDGESDWSPEFFVTPLPTPTITQTDDPLPDCSTGNATLVASAAYLPAGYAFHWYSNSTCTTEITTGVTGDNNNTLSYPISNGTQVWCRMEQRSTTTTFSYTNGIQTYAVPTGTVSITMEVWGAQGGYRSSSAYGGKGGYSVGTLTDLSGVTNLYVVVGGSGTSGGTSGGYNGGGSRDTYDGGGGATHIATASGLLSSLSGNQASVLIVAGGGGSDGGTSYVGGAGGGANGGSSTSGWGTGGIGGTQNAGGDNGGSFGQGGPGVYASSGYGGGGGGGWYGGGGGTPDTSVDDDRGGGGGSGYLKSTLTNASTTADIREGNGQAKITAIHPAGTTIESISLAGTITIECCNIDASLNVGPAD